MPRTGARRLGRFAPSPRSIAVGVALTAIAVGVYAALRESSAFAIRRIEVRGAPLQVSAEVRTALAPLLGRNLLALDGGSLARRVDALPTVVSVGYDRAFPHTLRLTVVAEDPVAVLHRGAETWLLSGRGRVIARVPARTSGALARIWVPTRTPVKLGSFVPAGEGLIAARALALTSRFPARIAVATFKHGQLALRLRSGLELRLGDPTDVRLKLAIARRALHRLPTGTAYLDVSLPQRPVAGPANPQVSSGG
jgi:cell division protein FtsQ